MTSNSTVLPKMKKAVRVGVTGHRSLSPAYVDTIQQTVEDVLRSIRGVVEQSVTPHGCEGAFDTGVRLIAISPIARGADQLVATIALREGYDLQCPLPFPREEYRKDFEARGTDVESFDHLLERASAIVELDGRREHSRMAAW